VLFVTCLSKYVCVNKKLPQVSNKNLPQTQTQTQAQTQTQTQTHTHTHRLRLIRISFVPPANVLGAQRHHISMRATEPGMGCTCKDECDVLSSARQLGSSNEGRWPSRWYHSCFCSPYSIAHAIGIYNILRLSHRCFRRKMSWGQHSVAQQRRSRMMRALPSTIRQSMLPRLRVKANGLR
jgi:hypothetical protein